MTLKTGTAGNHIEAFNQIVGAGWPTVWQADGEVVLRGPGSTGVPVFLGLRIITIPASQTYALQCFGMVGVNPGATRIEDHVNVSPGKYLYLDNGPMDFWISASDRRIIATFQISTVFEMLYAGLVRPYAPPVEDGRNGAYPYPYLLAASSGYLSPDNANWRSTSDGHSLVNSPRIAGNLAQTPSSTAFLDPSGVWRGVAGRSAFNDHQSLCAITPDGAGDLLDWGLTPGSTTQIGYRQQRDAVGRCYGGYLELRFMHIVDMASNATYGEVDGLYQVPARGGGVSAKDTVGMDGITHLVVQNAFRTGNGDYMAQALA